MNYHITAVDTTAEGHLYVVVDFGDGWIEDFIFPDLTPEQDVAGIVRRVIETHGAKSFSGWRVDPNVVLGGPDPRGTKAIAKALLP